MLCDDKPDIAGNDTPSRCSEDDLSDTGSTLVATRKMQLERLTSSIARCICVIFLQVFSQLALADSINTLIVVPDAKGPAKEIYARVITGIETLDTLNTSVIAIESGTTPQALLKEIVSQGAELVIPIGNGSYKLCSEILSSGQSGTTFVAGGISGKPNGIPTLSLTASAQTTLQEVKRYMPEVADVRLVYNEHINGWWYKQAAAAAESLGLEVIGYRAESIQDGVKLYNQLLKDANKGTSAVWLPLKGIVPSKTILPLVLEKAWSKKLPVISNNPSHARLGGLIALYPDHYAMGQQLAAFAYKHHAGEDIAQITGTETVNKAINTRTSAHVGIRIDNEQLKTFDKVFPAMR